MGDNFLFRVIRFIFENFLSCMWFVFVNGISFIFFLVSFVLIVILRIFFGFLFIIIFFNI